MSTATVLAAYSLSKAYGRRLVVDRLDLEVGRGEVFGFLGPNGAGKTTTIRMLLGLVRPTAGVAAVLGQDVRAHSAEVLPRVGALIEAPALYEYLSGRDNLCCFGDILGGVAESRIDEVLDLVDLRARQKDRVRTYSLGMKQRLAIAVALLHDPALLVLDEPANGLDPAGIAEIRRLLRQLAAAGKTVFMSSHVLAHVQQTCDRVAIIAGGRLVLVAPIRELIRASGEFELRIDDARAALTVIRAQPWGASARIEAGVLVCPSPTGKGRDLLDALVRLGVHPDGVAERTTSLEDVFMLLTEGEKER
jgi:ABC-2 type transport system ATP-binding protein